MRHLVLEFVVELDGERDQRLGQQRGQRPVRRQPRLGCGAGVASGAARCVRRAGFPAAARAGGRGTCARLLQAGADQQRPRRARLGGAAREPGRARRAPRGRRPASRTSRAPPASRPGRPGPPTGAAPPAGATARPANPVAERQAQPAARRGQPGDPVQQPVHVVRVEVDEQALGDPRGRLVRVAGPRPRSAAGQSSRRSHGTVIRSQPGTACCAASTWFLASSTSGVSSSKQRMPGGQGSRNARASKPAPSSTTCRAPSAQAGRAARRGTRCGPPPTAAARPRAARPARRARPGRRSGLAPRRRPGGRAPRTPRPADRRTAGPAGRSPRARIAATVSPVPPTPSSIRLADQAAGATLTSRVMASASVSKSCGSPCSANAMASDAGSLGFFAGRGATAVDVPGLARDSASYRPHRRRTAQPAAGSFGDRPIVSAVQQGYSRSLERSGPGPARRDPHRHGRPRLRCSCPLASTRCEPERRVSIHPSRFNAARMRAALAMGEHARQGRPTDSVERRRTGGHAMKSDRLG